MEVGRSPMEVGRRKKEDRKTEKDQTLTRWEWVSFVWGANSIHPVFCIFQKFEISYKLLG